MKKVGDKLIPKTEDEFDAEDIKKVENYAKAINMLYCAVNPDDYRKISCCSTAKEMWDKLEVTYDGTDQVREAKIDFLTQEYGMFRMKEHEKIDDMKCIALKAFKEPTMNDSSDDDEVKLVMKKFCKLLRKKEKVEDGPVCYGCGEAGHIKNKCPKSGRNSQHFKRQRAYISWGGDSGDESSEQEEEEEANLCLIAQEEEESANNENQEFGSEEELTRFITYFAKRPISPPRVLPELFPQQKGYYDLDNQLKESGLWPFVSRNRTAFNPAYVRVFYSNLRRDGDTIRSSINLCDIEFDLATFAWVAGLPIRGDDIVTYGGDDWILNNEAVVIRELGITNLIRHSGAPTIHSAPPDKRLLLYIITRILRPRDSSHTSLFNEDLKAIHAIIHGASINWAKFLMIHMTDCASITTERSLPYAFLVMDLIVSADIHIAGPDTKMTKLWIIQDSTFRKKSGDRTGAGRSRAPAPAPAKASLQSIADTLNRLTITVDGMGQYLERMDSTLQRQNHNMTAYFCGINYVPPPFDSTILGKNYEGEDEEDDSYAPSSSPDEADFEDAVDGDPMDVEDDEDDENEDDDAEDEDAAA
ncbi:unnamed protein product [Cuscuta campestris]|uniref:CCHC-type domain-containing protein n=1 Tax=Cuscuta campestris TaxID=132261 RepID=A0A484M682_9ASTE|nr:unnamed protein product [Cuscuta campestris]